MNNDKEQAFEKAKEEINCNDLVITSITDAEQLHELLLEFRQRLFFTGIIEVMPHYRGEQKYGWDIRPGIFRPPLNITDPIFAKQLEQLAIKEFDRVIREKIGRNILRNPFDNEKYGKEWDLLFQAQHSGIKTTLTDWTAFIMSALYFATEESNEETVEKSDGQMWCFMVPTIKILGHSDFPERHTFYDMNPFEMKETYLINPSSYLENIEDRIFEYRMYRQKGRFVMCSNNTCHIPLNEMTDLKKYLFRFRIPSAYKSQIRKELESKDMIRAKMYIDENPRRQHIITDINNVVFN